MESELENMMWIVMGKTEERVFEKSEPMKGWRAAEYCYALNCGYKKANVNIRYYITPILDI